MKEIKKGQRVRVIKGANNNSGVPVGLETTVFMGQTWMGVDGKMHTFDSITIMMSHGPQDVPVDCVEVISPFDCLFG